MPSQPSVSTEPLTDALCGDTFLKRSLGAALLGASEIVGLERYTECLRRLKRSNEHVVASCLEAAEALAALGNSNTNAHNREQKEALKLAKKAVRDVLLWRSLATPWAWIPVTLWSEPSRKLAAIRTAMGTRSRS